MQRDRALVTFPYTSIGSLRFLNFVLNTQPVYSQIISRLQQGQKFLDLGCFLGQDIRRLIFDGAPAENIYGVDLKPEFVDLGYEFFLDRSKLRSKFLIGDIFDPSSDITQLDGEIDIVYASSFFHLFGWERQVEVGKRVVQLLRPQKGSLVVGRQLGNLTAKDHPFEIARSGSSFMHNVESFQKMWKEIGDATGTSWKVEGSLDEEEFSKEEITKWGDPKLRRLLFVVERE